MKIFWRQHKLGVIILGGLTLLFALVYFLAVPLIRHIGKLTNEIEEKKIDQEIEEARVSGLMEMERNWNDFSASQESMDVIVDPNNQIGFIESIESIAQKTGNAIVLEIGDKADPKEIAKIKKANKSKGLEPGILDNIHYSDYFALQINIMGGYENLFNFIHKLENGRFYVNIISIEAEKKIKNESSSRIVRNEKEADLDSEEEILSTNINAIVYIKQ